MTQPQPDRPYCLDNTSAPPIWRGFLIYTRRLLARPLLRRLGYTTLMDSHQKKKIDERPWGKFEQFTSNEASTVKILTINPHQRFSLQYHHHRDEFLRVLSGPAKVTIGDQEISANKGDEFFIPRETKHRVEATGSPVEFLEISFGDFDENDIVRVADDFGRA